MEKGDSGGLPTLRMEDVHLFKWNQPGGRVLEQLKVLYNHQKGTGAAFGVQPDVTLFSSDGGCVEAHRIVLSLCCGYFQELFEKISQAESQKMKDGPAVVVLGNVKTRQLNQVLQFIYTGEVAVPTEQLEEFQNIGNVFQIEEIMNYRVTARDLSDTQCESSFMLNVGDNNDANVLVGGVSENDHESPVAASSSSILHENVVHEDLDISYGIYPIKVEGESDMTLAPVDQLVEISEQSSSGEEWQLSSASETDEEDNDPTYEEKSGRKTTRRRKTTASVNNGVTDQNQRKATKIDWKEQEPVLEETLKLDWRVGYNKRLELGTVNATTYYCAFGGRQCPAQLRKKIMKNGSVVWMNNNVPHSPHPKSPRKGQTINWKETESVSDEILQLNWRINYTRETGSSTFYYCATGGKRCPAKLMKTVSSDGTVVWFGNSAPHNFNPGILDMSDMLD